MSSEAPHKPRIPVPWRLRDQVQVLAVLGPLFGCFPHRSAVPRQAYRTRARWRAAANRLAAAGWGRLGDGCPGIAAAKLCRPTFVIPGGDLRACGLPTVCPFCWGREVANRFDRLDAVFFPLVGGSTGRRRAFRPVMLPPGVPAPEPVSVPRPVRMQAQGRTLVTRTRIIRVPAYLDRTDGSRVDVLRDFLAARTNGKARYIDDAGIYLRRTEVARGMGAIGPAGGCFESIAADVAKTGTDWDVRICQIWLVPAGKSLPPPVDWDIAPVRQRVVADPWRTDLAKAVARAHRYPRCILRARTPVGATMQLIEARRGLRLAAGFGAFYNSRQDV